MAILAIDAGNTTGGFTDQLALDDVAKDTGAAVVVAPGGGSYVGGGGFLAVGVGVDVARKKDGERTSAGEDDAKGNDSAEDVQKAIAGVNYLSAGAPHPINKPL